jgi:hypothetical protein
VPEAHSSTYYMGVYAAISGAQLLLLQINFMSIVRYGIRAGRCACVCRRAVVCCSQRVRRRGRMRGIVAAR